jgi:hypothetical protein
MALSTSELRRAWAPACRSKGKVFLPAYAALDAAFRKHRYDIRPGDSGAYNCRTITGGSGYSLHAYGPGYSYEYWDGSSFSTSLAVDINWQTNPYGPRLITDMPRAMIDDIVRIQTNNGRQVWGWGGYYSGNKDAMHFEIVCSPGDLSTGINPRTIPGGSSGPIDEEFDLSAEQYNDIKARLDRIERRINEVESEETRRFETAVSALAIIKRVDGKLPGGETIKQTVRNVRRIGLKLGIGTIEGANPDV